MKILDKNAFEEIRTWIHRNARPMEMAMWNYHYENGSIEDIINELAYYQNKDGGFGSGYEPDCWNVESSPYVTLKVIEMLRKSGIAEKLGKYHPIIQGSLLYLESGVHMGESGWDFSIPSNDGYPRAPWWTYNEEVNKVQNLGITAALCGFILRFGEAESDVYQTAINFTKQIMKMVSETEDFGEMGIGGIRVLLEDVIGCSLSNTIPCEGISEKLQEAANRSIERNPEQWQYYTPRPSSFIESPASLFYKGNEDIVQVQLDYMIDTRNPGGVWNINWSWFDLGEQYSREFAVSENWWKSIIAIDILDFLKNFDRVEDGTI